MLGPTRVRTALDDVLNTIEGIGKTEFFDPHRIVRQLDRHPAALPILYPVLHKGVELGAAQHKAPRWLPRLLDQVKHFAPVLKEAARREAIPPEAAQWPGLADIAAHSSSPASKEKARELLTELGLE